MTPPKRTAPLTRANARLTIAPTPELIDLIERKWPVRISRHALVRLALQRGLEGLASLPAAECRDLLIEQVLGPVEP